MDIVEPLFATLLGANLFWLFLWIYLAMSAWENEERATQMIAASLGTVFPLLTFLAIYFLRIIIISII